MESWRSELRFSEPVELMSSSRQTHVVFFTLTCLIRSLASSELQETICICRNSLCIRHEEQSAFRSLNESKKSGRLRICFASVRLRKPHTIFVPRAQYYAQPIVEVITQVCITQNAYSSCHNTTQLKIRLRVIQRKIRKLAHLIVRNYCAVKRKLFRKKLTLHWKYLLYC